MGVVFLIILFFILNQVIFAAYSKRHSFFDRKKMNLLYVYHLFFYGVYSAYAYFNLSDSHAYFRFLNSYDGNWFSTFGTDTAFIHFLAYPFYKIGFDYNMLMCIFAWFGYLGFLYAYLFFREKIPLKVRVFKRIDLMTLILFFPNMHFWTSSLGKGAPIFLGLMMFTYAIAEPKSRLPLLFLSSAVIFYIRPHVFLFVALGAVMGYMSGREKIALWKKILIYVCMIGAVYIAQDKILGVMGLQNSDDIIGDFEQAAEKNAEDLSHAGSGVAMASYPLPLKLFTFWFRPLFIDAPNVLGIITSAENLLYLLLFLKILKKDFIKFLRKSPSMVKMSFVIFLSASVAMTFVMSNLGIIMRQKTMVMYYLFFVIYYYLAQKKYNQILRLKRMKRARAQNLEVKGEVIVN